MESTFSLIANACSILSLLVSLFVANSVIKIKNEIGNNKVSVSGNTRVGGDFTGRDKK
jgi:hypothetical protein